MSKRDVFGQLPTGYGNSLTFQQLPGVLKSLIRLVVLISPLLNYLRSLEIEAAFIGESKAKDQEILYGKLGGGGRGVALLHGSQESLTGDEKFRAMFSKEFYQKNTVAVACHEAHTSVHW